MDNIETYHSFGQMWDDDHENLLGGYFAPNGDYYLTLQHVDDNGIKSLPVNFRLSLSGSHISQDLKFKIIDCLKSLPNEYYEED